MTLENKYLMKKLDTKLHRIIPNFIKLKYKYEHIHTEKIQNTS